MRVLFDQMPCGPLSGSGQYAAIDRIMNLQQCYPECCTVQHVPLLICAGFMADKHKLQRVSVGLSDKEYAELQAMSEKHRVSLAWLGRQAITEFLERYRNQELQLPLTLERGERKASNG